MKKNLPLRYVIALAVSFGLVLPAVFSGWRTYTQQKTELTARLRSDQEHLNAMLSKSLAQSLWNMDVEMGKRLIEAASIDERVAQITVLATNRSGTLSPADGLNFRRSTLAHEKPMLMEVPVISGKIQVGLLQTAMSTDLLDEQLTREFSRFVLTTIAQLMLSLGLIMVILEVRFVQPLERLRSDSARLARRELEYPLEWNRSDELGELGSSLEATRRSLRAAFQELRESEQRFKSLTSLSSDWYWERDKEDKLTMISSGFTELTGIDLKEILGKKRSSLGGFEYPSEQWEHYQECVARRQPFHKLEWRVRRTDGQIRYGVAMGEPIFDSQGEFQGYRGIGRDITSEKLAEEAQRSTARLRLMVEHLPAGAVYIEDDRLLINHAIENITGYARDEIISKTEWFDKVFGKKSQLIQKLYEQDHANGFLSPRELEIVRKDGSHRLVEFSAYADQFSEVWLVHDITQQKLFEASLKQSLQDFDAIFNNTNVGIEYVKDRRIIRCNRSFEQMLGYDPGELTGQSTRIYYQSEADWLAHGEIVYSSSTPGEIVSTEWQYRKKDGNLIWCSINGKLTDPQAPGKGVIVVTLDITDRKAAEAAFQQTFQEQQVIFENASAGIVLVKDRIIMRCNRSLEVMLGYGSGELIGKSTHLMFPSQESYDAFDATAYPAIRAGQSWAGEWEMIRKNGSRFWYSAQGRLIDVHDPDKGSIWVAQDTTERKRTEATLIRTKNRLENSLTDIERTHREVSMLGELSSFLQACPNLQEAFLGVSDFTPRIFPHSAGALYLIEDDGETMTEKASWGNESLRGHSFTGGACWALRRGQTYRMDIPSKALCCSHLLPAPDKQHPYVCLPLTAQGETFGMLFIEHHQELSGEKLDIRHRLAVSVAEQSGLALANIQLRDTLHQQSVRDPLTGLFNRRHMNDALRKELLAARQHSSIVALAIIDVDFFKQFNDTFGHDAGDHVLQSVAKVLQDQAQESEIMCRFGGEEFVVIFCNTELSAAMRRTEHILAAIRSLELRHGNRHLGNITASLGLSLYPADAITSEALLERADAALYHAKETGRNRAVYCGQINERAAS
jgi:diguanylate cyclase (GGDEF)-like protein/PAS domain S-box-containing protein